MALQKSKQGDGQRGKGGDNDFRLCGHPEAVPLDITNKAGPRARPRAFQTEGTASATAQRPGQA